MTNTPTESGGYFAADRDANDELVRLRILEEVTDPITFRHLDALGIATGWRCLDVGAGAGSVARWLAERVGPSGQVVAADMDPRFLGDLRGAANTEVRAFDLTRDELEIDSYDLVHCRSVLTHLDDPPGALRHLLDAVRPGGWLVVEDPDYAIFEASDPAHPRAGGFQTCFQARIGFLLAANVMNLRYGRTLPMHFAALGLTATGNEACTVVEYGCSPLSQLMMQSFAPIDDAMVAAGIIAAADVDDTRAALTDPSFMYRGGLMVSTWGRKR